MRSCSSCSGWPSQASWQAFRLSLERRPHPCSRCRARAAAAVALCVSALISGVATVITCIARHKALSRLAGAAVKQMAAHDGRDVHLSAHPAAQTPIGVCESFERSACAARSNVLERSAAQHGAGKALRHQRRGCAVLRRSAAGALGTSDRASRAAVQVPLGRVALASFGNPFFFGLLCGRSCESTPKPSRQWRRAGRVSGVEVWAGPPPPLLCYYPLSRPESGLFLKGSAPDTAISGIVSRLRSPEIAARVLAWIFRLGGRQCAARRRGDSHPRKR